MAKKKTKSQTKRAASSASSNGVVAGTKRKKVGATAGAKKKTAGKKKTAEKKAAEKKAAASKTARKKTANKKTAKKKAAQAEPVVEAEQVEAEPVVAERVEAALEAPLARRSAAKRRAVMEAILPLGTSARMARAAEAAVHAISSDKTLEVREAQEQADRDLEDVRAEALAQQTESQGPIDPAWRRSSRDPFVFFRAELERSEEDPADPHARWRTATERLRHEVQPGATPEQMADIEARLGVELPRTYYDFCLEWNGARLYTTETGCFRVLSATEILDEIKGPLCNRMVRPYLPVVDLGCGDYLALDTERPGKSGELPLYWWYGGEPKKKVADGFGQWLKKLVEGDGAPYWWE